MPAFKLPPHLSFCQLPTPIQKLQRFSHFLEGPEIYVKRDDLTGLALSGNKSRKLEFLLADAQAKGCDCILTCGSVQSNHARTTAVAAAKLGLKCHLMLGNGVNAPLVGNHFLSRLFGAEIEYLSREDYEKVEQMMEIRANEFRDSGRTPYIIPEGGSNYIGSLGYVKAIKEIAEQAQAQKLRFDHIIVPVGSAGTISGLLLGKYLYDIPFAVVGINVCDSADFFVGKVLKIVEDFQSRYDLKLGLTKNDIHIIDGYVGKGYGLSSQEEIEVIKRVALMEGVALDPVYTGKAMYGLTEQIRKGTFKQAQKILFLHTGGIFGLFPKASLFF